MSTRGEYVRVSASGAVDVDHGAGAYDDLPDRAERAALRRDLAATPYPTAIPRGAA